MTETDLTKVEELGLAIHSETEFDALTKDFQTFLPRVQLASSSSDMVKQGQVGVGEFVLIQNKNIIKLGKEVNMLVLSWQPKAIRFNSSNIVESSTNPADDVFKTIQKDFLSTNSGCAWGPEFLVYLPDQKEFATYLLGNKSSHREAKTMHKLLKSTALVRSHFVKGKNSFFAPVITQSSAVFEPPTSEEIKDAITKFTTAFTEEGEKVDEAANKG